MDIFSILFNIKVCYMFSLESKMYSNEYTQYTIFNITKRKYSKSAVLEFFQGTQERVRTAMVHEPSLFEPLKIHCTFAVREILAAV